MFIILRLTFFRKIIHVTHMKSVYICDVKFRVLGHLNKNYASSVSKSFLYFLLKIWCLGSDFFCLSWFSFLLCLCYFFFVFTLISFCHYLLYYLL